MDSVKAGGPLIAFVKLCYSANIPPLLIGGHGVGKSELLEQAACALGIDFIVRDLSLMEPTDLTGLPKAKGSVTVYLPPEFLPRSGRGLLVFEELNRAERYMRAPCLQLLSARTLNGYTLPPGWLPVAAINPSDQSDYQVDELDPALASRFAQVLVVPDRKTWLEWARGHHVHSSVMAYVESDTTVFDTAASNPRSWKHVSDLVWAAEKQLDLQSCLRAAVLGKVGDARGKAFMATLKANAEQPLRAADVLSAYPKHREKLRRWVTNGKLDLVRATLHAVCIELQPRENYDVHRRSRSHWSNLGHFLADLPGDLREEASTQFAGRGYQMPTAA